MDAEIASIVKSCAGRDKGKFFFIVEKDDEFALICNGKERRLENPKRKKLKPLQFIGDGSCRAAEKLRSGEKVTNSELRRALAEYNAVQPEDRGGM